MKIARKAALLWILPAFALGAQQITRFAVVDMTRIYSGVQTDARALRGWEERSAKVQEEIDKRTAELRELVARNDSFKSQKAEADMNGNDADSRKIGSEINRLTSEIDRKKASLETYYSTETRRLEDEKNRLADSRDFLNKVYNAMRVVAESEGYSMVLNLRENKGIAWYSQAIDITDKVIAYLKSSSR